MSELLKCINILEQFLSKDVFPSKRPNLFRYVEPLVRRIVEAEKKGEDSGVDTETIVQLIEYLTRKRRINENLENIYCLIRQIRDVSTLEIDSVSRLMMSLD